MNPTSETKFIVGCITLISLVCAVIGGFLLLKGFQSGELLVGIAGSGGGGLVGMLSMQRRVNPGESLSSTLQSISPAGPATGTAVPLNAPAAQTNSP
jgi:hypothetical protein